jgi:S-adenosylmethionine hydrolase
VLRYDREVSHPFISFLTDFGPDGHAPICRGVMLGIAPDAQIVDIAHGIRKYAIRDGAYLLWCALPYLPVGTHVAVVDPGVGTERMPIALRTGRGDVLVGPNNGLLLPAAERLGGLTEARILDNRALWLPTATSSTFHGRDIFSPVAAHLASGTPFEEVGAALPVDALVRLDFPRPTVALGEFRTAVQYIDSFGNVSLAGDASDLGAALGALNEGRRLGLEIGSESGSRRATATWERTFARVALGATLLFEDSFGQLALADNQGDVASRLGLAVDEAVIVRAV